MFTHNQLEVINHEMVKAIDKLNKDLLIRAELEQRVPPNPTPREVMAALWKGLKELETKC